jgi:tetratricopeptide (TPR) repeat protein
MSRRDQALMEGFMGPDYPELSHEADVLAARERAVTLAPDHPDAWYFLGDQYFHQGRYLGYTDWMARSEAWFKRAVALDSTFAGPVSHLVDLAVERGDTAAVRAFGERLLATEGGHGGGYALLVRWEMAQALNDTALRQEVRASLDTMSSRPPPRLASVMLWRGRGGTPLDSDEFLGILAQRASTRGERTEYLAFRMATLLDTGRPGQAAAVVDSLGRLAAAPTDQAAFEVLAALYWDGDNAAGAAAATRLAPVAEDALAPDAERRGAQYRAACALGLWRVAHEALGSVPRLLARLRGAGRDRDGADIARDAELCATLLEGMLAVAQGSPDARAAVDRADSLMRRGPPQPQDFPFSQFRFSYENLAVARLYERLGAHREGMAAAQRGGFFGANPSSYLRAEGRLAARVGEHDIARRAYAEFVRLWSDAEPALADEVEEVKAELARLTREGG